MTSRLYVLPRRVAVAHLLVGCCLLCVGCEGWGGGKGGLPEVKNPFAKKATPSESQAGSLTSLSASAWSIV